MDHVVLGRGSDGVWIMAGGRASAAVNGRSHVSKPATSLDHVPV